MEKNIKNNVLLFLKKQQSAPERVLSTHSRASLPLYILKKKIINNSKLIPFKVKDSNLKPRKYLPPVSKEWKNTIYTFNPNLQKNLPIYDINLNGLIKSYFNLFLKKSAEYVFNDTVFRSPREMRKTTGRVYASNVEIKHNNNKAILTIYTYNREKIGLLTRIKLRKNSLAQKIKIILNLLLSLRKRSSAIDPATSCGSEYLSASASFGEVFGKEAGSQSANAKLGGAKLYNLYKKIMKALLYEELNIIRKYKIKLDINRNKFEEKFLYKLKNLIGKYYSKKVEFNIVNLKSIILNSDLFTYILRLKIRYTKSRFANMMKFVINKTKLPKSNRFLEKSHLVLSKDMYSHLNLFENKYKNTSLYFILSKKTNEYNLSEFLNQLYNNISLKNFASLSASTVAREEGVACRDKVKAISLEHGQAQVQAQAPVIASLQNNTVGEFVRAPDAKFSPLSKLNEIVFNSIKYKNMGGVRLEVKGRLTKRYRADRSLFNAQWKGGLKNMDSSYKRLSSVSMRGYAKSNVEYSIFTYKRRVGSFAVKGWISGK
jgi:hypothetical protein